MKEEQSAPIANEAQNTSTFSNELQYIKVRLQSYIEQDFIDSFNEKVNGNWLHKWYKCPAKKHICFVEV